MTKWLALLLYIQEFPSSNLGRETNYMTDFCIVPQFLQANAGIVP
jgi:hypothetical protein